MLRTHFLGKNSVKRSHYKLKIIVSKYLLSKKLAKTDHNLRAYLNMKVLQHLICVFVLLIGNFSLTAQDLHKTLYNMMPLSVNPAYTGDFEGTLRISGMLKDQQSTWTTPSLSIDVPIIMIRGRDWLSAGISLDYDRSGDLALIQNRRSISVSYHLSLDKKGNDYFVLGYQFGSDGFFLRDINNPNAAIFGDGTDPLQSGQQIPSTSDDDVSQSFNNIGVMYRSKIDKNTLINIGLSYSYIFRQNGSIISEADNTGSVDKSPSKFVLHGLVDRVINDNLSVHPSFLVRNRGTEGTEVLVQSMWGYLIRPDLDLRIKGGLGYDIDVGPSLLLGADYGEWRFGLAIDFPITGIAATRQGFGGFEISASKIINIYKKPAVEPTICCPDL